MDKVIIKENSTHKAVRENGRINIYTKGFYIEDLHYSDELIYSVPEEDEDDLFAIFERFDEDNRVNVSEFTSAYH